MTTVYTNHHRRPLLDGWELTAEERRELDYLTDEEIEEAVARFVRVYGEVLDLHEFTALSPERYPAHDRPPFRGWDGVLTTSHFSGLLVRFDAEAPDEFVIVGQFVS
jgi:hypothetical protein